jgi:hypothetical protein
MNCIRKAKSLSSEIKEKIDGSDDINYFGDEDEAIINGYVPIGKYAEVVEMAHKYGGEEGAPYIIEETHEVHISIDIE